ncbi:MULTISPECIES: hypothetical protein [Bacillus]|uniref:Uncharacterized protein n=4 Tax=Bacillaceae TaxID=186817 RepID=A0A0B5NQ76_BACTU|nr:MULTISPECIES: hypothetical protein [Bacillus]EEN00074.1 hypothetical protein bthur0014_55690 [Bacillus thuringiensis IBL 4222]KRD80588.1 hypothetical protein ASE53_16075 [Bacillus sp. Root11]MEC2533127.1 hypothetical protein [Bacillus cereus]MED1153893.1 hypothetical protein [Bacillus paranthracis]OUB09262.1 hypothetical protein BK708_32530 [Bacillus thuringiensis serovar yunnanensis]RCX39210.1 hypothetical protein DEU45_105439 [Bacillus sp. AG102]
MAMDFEQNNNINLEVRVQHGDKHFVAGFVTVVSNDHTYIPNMPFLTQVEASTSLGVVSYHRTDDYDFYLLVEKQDYGNVSYYLLNSTHITEEDVRKGYIVLPDFVGDSETFLNYVKQQLVFEGNPRD